MDSLVDVTPTTQDRRWLFVHERTYAYHTILEDEGLCPHNTGAHLEEVLHFYQLKKYRQNLTGCAKACGEEKYSCEKHK